MNKIQNFLKYITSIMINLITPREFELMRDIEQYYQTQIEPLPEDLSSYTAGMYLIERK